MATATETSASTADTLVELTNQLIAPVVQTANTAADVWLSALDAMAETQRRLTAHTPFEPFAGLLSVQTRMTRQLLDAYSSVGERLTAVDDPTTRTTPTGAKADRTQGAAVTKRTRKPADATAGPGEPPIAGYDSMTAEQVVAKLPELPQVTLAHIEAYEKSHQSRSTVLERIGSLRGDEPAPGYDELTAEQATHLLADGDAEFAGRIRDYERRHKGRSTVLQAAERRLDTSEQQ
jgi:hypothetical protein